MKLIARIFTVATLAALVALVAAPAATARPGNGQGNNGHGNARTYSVTVTNVTEGQILTPPVFAAHNRSADVFDVGQPASFGVKEIAENGNLAPLADALTGVKGVRDSGIGGGADGPLFAGDSRTFSIETNRTARLLSTVQMVVCTNDGITGIDSTPLPVKLGETVTVYTVAYDAGTEINTNSLDDFVPPCSGFETGTGTSNPALAEGGVITMHPGGTGDIAELWPFDASSAVASYTITRTN